MSKYNLIDDGLFLFPNADFNTATSKLITKEWCYIDDRNSTGGQWNIKGYATVRGYDSSLAQSDQVWNIYIPHSNAVRLSGAQGNPTGTIEQNIILTRSGKCTLTFWSRSDFYASASSATPSQLQVKIGDSIPQTVTCGASWEQHKMEFNGASILQGSNSVQVPLSFTCTGDVKAPDVPTLRNIEIYYNNTAVAILLPQGKTKIVYTPNKNIGKQQFLVKDTDDQLLAGAWVKFTLSVGAAGVRFINGQQSILLQCDSNAVVTLPEGSLHADNDINGSLILHVGEDEALQTGFIKQGSSDAFIEINISSPLKMKPDSSVDNLLAQYQKYNTTPPERMNYKITPADSENGLSIEGKTEGSLSNSNNHFSVPHLKLGHSYNAGPYIITFSDPDGVASDASLQVDVMTTADFNVVLYPNDMGSNGLRQDVDTSSAESILGRTDRDWYVQVLSSKAPNAAIEGLPLWFDIVLTDPDVKAWISDTPSMVTDRDGKIPLPPIITGNIPGQFSLRVYYGKERVGEYKFNVMQGRYIKTIDFSDYQIALRVSAEEGNGWDFVTAYTDTNKSEPAHQGKMTFYINNDEAIPRTGARWQEGNRETVTANIGLRGVAYLPTLEPGNTPGEISIEASANNVRTTSPKKYKITS